jgi:tetratricopeptide (TPR) repeat protein
MVRRSPGCGQDTVQNHAPAEGNGPGRSVETNRSPGVAVKGPVTAHDDGAGHPAAEQLAAFAEGTLSPSDREAVQQHASACDDCRHAIADAVAYLDSQGLLPKPGPFRRWRLVTGVAGGLAAAAALVLFVQLQPWSTEASHAAAIAQLVTAYQDQATRAAEGRLSGGFPYAPAPALTRGDADARVSTGVALAAEEIERAAAGEQTAAALWSVGVSRLAKQDVEAAIVALEEAARLEATNAELQNDLAVAYAARARLTSNPAQWRRALAAADRALTLSPGMPEALFNRALALASLGDPAAPGASQTLREREPDSPWVTDRTLIDVGQ